jgi:hypothetical protein
MFPEPGLPLRGISMAAAAPGIVANSPCPFVMFSWKPSIGDKAGSLTRDTHRSGEDPRRQASHGGGGRAKADHVRRPGTVSGLGQRPGRGSARATDSHAERRTLELKDYRLRWRCRDRETENREDGLRRASPLPKRGLGAALLAAPLPVGILPRCRVGVHHKRLPRA